MNLALLTEQNNVRNCKKLLRGEIAENTGIYYNGERIAELRESDDLEEACKFFRMLGEAEQ